MLLKVTTSDYRLKRLLQVILLPFTEGAHSIMLYFISKIVTHIQFLTSLQHVKTEEGRKDTVTSFLVSNT